MLCRVLVRCRRLDLWGLGQTGTWRPLQGAEGSACQQADLTVDVFEVGGVQQLWRVGQRPVRVFPQLLRLFVRNLQNIKTLMMKYDDLKPRHTNLSLLHIRSEREIKLIKNQLLSFCLSF